MSTKAPRKEHRTRAKQTVKISATETRISIRPTADLDAALDLYCVANKGMTRTQAVVKALTNLIPKDLQNRAHRRVLRNNRKLTALALKMTTA